MDQPSPYRRSYPNKRLDEAYRRYVRGEASLRDLVRSSKLSLRTLQRYSSRDHWVVEEEEWKAKASEEVAQLTQMAAMAPDVAAGGVSLAAGVTVKDVILGVLKRQQRFWDRVESRVLETFEEIERRAMDRKAAMPVGQLIGLLNVAEKASTNVRKAYGIPDVTRMEFEDKTPTAKKHADVIREKRAQRLRDAETAQKEAPGHAVN